MAQTRKSPVALLLVVLILLMIWPLYNVFVAFSAAFRPPFNMYWVFQILLNFAIILVLMTLAVTLYVRTIRGDDDKSSQSL